MFGSPHASPFLSPSNHRPPSRTPSLLSLLRKHEQRQQEQQTTSSQVSTPDPLDSELAGMGLYSPSKSPPTRAASSATDSSVGQRPTGLIRHRHRPHIYEKAHRAKVKSEREKMRAELILKAYENKRRNGYQSSIADFEGYLNYFDQVKSAVPHDPTKVISPLSTVKDETLKRALFIARASMQERKPLNFDTSALDILQRKWRARDAQLEEDLKPKIPPYPKSLPPVDEESVRTLLNKRGTIAKYAREAVDEKDLLRLRPGQWLNDEIINFYGALLLGRSEGSKENVPNGPVVGEVVKGRGQPLNVHYFSTFFWTKLTGEGYDKGRLAKWTKKIDIFSKDVILVPVNHHNAHWTAAAINFRRKRVESYDSMGMAKEVVFSHLRKYIDAEHQNKKKKPFDFSDWQDYAPDDLTPQQENGYDCGIFTCQFMENLSRGEEVFRFTQGDMPYLRRRMVWEIGHTRLRDD